MKEKTKVESIERNNGKKNRTRRKLVLDYVPSMSRGITIHACTECAIFWGHLF